ncbi:hypothetical protein ACJX0J_023866, partial [Zea mays]
EVLVQKSLHSPPRLAQRHRRGHELIRNFPVAVTGIAYGLDIFSNTFVWIGHTNANRASEMNGNNHMELCLVEFIHHSLAMQGIQDLRLKNFTATEDECLWTTQLRVER